MTFEKKILPNGLRLILVPKAESLATTVMVLVEAGSKYETKEINGISHFLEHMCFKGTKNRPRPINLTAELDGLGASYNASTFHELTNYYIKVKNSSFDKALEIIADLYLNPIFDPKEIDKERGVIIEEINMYEDTPRRRVQDLFMTLLYGDQPAGWDIAGTKEVIRRLKREDFLDYRSKHYQAQSTVIVIAGGFNENGIVEKVERFFQELERGIKSPKAPVVEKQEEPAELIKHKESDQTHLILGFRAFDVFDKRRFALEVLADILGGGMSSRLFQRVREELGAAYYVGASVDLYTDHGFIAMAAGVDHKKISDVIEASLEEFAELKNKKVDEEELERAKEHLIGHLFLSLETSDELAFYYGLEEILGLPLTPPKELAEKLRAVTAEDIKAVAEELFRNEKLNLAVIGPFKEKTFSDILKI